jgi:hypothetical protein
MSRPDLAELSGVSVATTLASEQAVLATGAAGLGPARPLCARLSRGSILEQRVAIPGLGGEDAA